MPGRYPYHRQEHGNFFGVFSNESFLYQHAIPTPHIFSSESFLYQHAITTPYTFTPPPWQHVLYYGGQYEHW